ncbi:hypothetical protein DRP98_03105, partial [candidate division KSB1 bacterium]
ILDQQKLYLMKSQKTHLYLIFLECLLLAAAGWHCAGLRPRPYVKGKIPIIRVLIAANNSNLVISSKGAFRFLSEGKVLFQEPKGIRVSIQCDENGNFAIVSAGGKISFVTRQLTVQSANPRQWLCLNDVPYRGRFEIKLTNRHSLLVINTIDLESYLKGVVPAEIGVQDHIELEAMKAQAVAARTYALEKLEHSSPDSDYNLKASVADQVYKGVAGESSMGNRAVESTIGEVMTYKGNLIRAYYHSTCGGRTEFGENVWEIHEPYLEGIADNFGDGDFCSISPHYRWIEIWDVDKLALELCSYLEDNHSPSRAVHLQSLTVEERFPSGRVKKLKIILNDREYCLQGNRIRWALRRPDKTPLRSTLFKVRTFSKAGQIEAVMLIGAGNGHGVGMCQWGAIGMAQQGFSYKQILKHYYRGVKIERYY